MVDKLTVKQITNKMAEFRKIPLTVLDKTIEAGRFSRQYLFICDRSEQASVYFSYKATLRDFHKEVIKTRMGN